MAPRSMTMSISSAPSSTARRTSASFTSRGDWPLGNAVATLAILTDDPASACFATGTRFGIHAHRGAGPDARIARRAGMSALAHIARTLPGVSFPSSVVRSIMRTASLRPATLAAFLSERLPSAAARSSTATWSTGGGGGIEERIWRRAGARPVPRYVTGSRARATSAKWRPTAHGFGGGAPRPWRACDGDARPRPASSGASRSASCSGGASSARGARPRKRASA